MQAARVFEKIRELASARVAVPQSLEYHHPSASWQSRPQREPAGETWQLTERGITSKQFIAAKTGERDRDSSRACSLARVVGVDSVAGGLIERGEQPVEVLRDLRAGENARVMLRARSEEHTSELQSHSF